MGSGDKTANLWRLPSDLCSATCVGTLAGHSGGILSVAFHPSREVVCTSRFDDTAKMGADFRFFCVNDLSYVSV